MSQVQGWGQPEEDSRRHRGRHGEEQHGAIDADRVQPRDLYRARRHQRTNTPPRQQRAERTARDRNQEALGEELPHQIGAPRTKRDTDGHLLAADRRAREQQVGDIRAGDEQYGGDGAHQHDQAQPIFAYQLGLERSHSGAAIVVRLRIRGGETGRDAADFGVGRGHTGAGRQPADDVNEVRAALLHELRHQRHRAQRQPRLYLLGLDWELKPRRHDANDGEALALQRHAGSDDGRRPAEAMDPCRLGDHRHRLRPFRIVGGQ